ncbi:MAG: NAD(P)-dependent oxidoreductase [Azoarcus sp.]|nr:NAD(P)-dependent oxidoreductase [Azoarcus sp.]
MKVALIGATGFVGSALLAEALTRGHQVTALVSRPEKLAARSGLTALKTDALDSGSLSAQLRGHEAVISAFSGHAQTEIFNYYLRGIRSIIDATKAAGVPRLLVVGGAASLEVAPGVKLLDTPEFPAQWKETAAGALEALKLLRAEEVLDWTFLSPSAHLEPGKRSGKFRLGTDQLLVDAEGNSRISLEDYAVAMIDELEQPAHSRKRFTVGY